MEKERIMNEEMDNQETQTRELEDYSKGELVEIVKRLAEIPSMSMEKLIGLDYSVPDLKEGIKIGSRLAGIYLSLIGAGVDEETASSLLVNESPSKNNIDCAKIGAIQQQTNGTKQCVRVQWLSHVKQNPQFYF